MSFINNLKITITMFKQKRNEKLSLIHQSYPKEDYPMYWADRNGVYVRTLKKGVKIL